ESRADVKVHGRVLRNTELLTHRRSIRFAQPRMKRFQIDAIVDDVELRLRGAEMRADFVPDHARVADYGPQPRAFEQAPFRGERIAVIGIEREAEPAEGAERRAAVVQPLGVDPVAGAVDVAARYALVRLHEIKRPSGDFAAHCPRETPVPPYAT